MLDCALFASQVESLCRRRHWTAEAVEQLADLDEALHDSDRLGELAAAVALLGSSLPPDRWLAGRTLALAAVQIAEAVREVPLPSGTGPSALWDESLARLVWLARWFNALSGEPVDVPSLRVLHKKGADFMAAAGTWSLPAETLRDWDARLEKEETTATLDAFRAQVSELTAEVKDLRARLEKYEPPADAPPADQPRTPKPPAA